MGRWERMVSKSSGIWRSLDRDTIEPESAMVTVVKILCSSLELDRGDNAVDLWS